MSKVALHDPGKCARRDLHVGTNGIGYNEKLIKALLPKAPLDSWRMVFDRPWRPKWQCASACSTRRPKCCARFTASISAKTRIRERGRSGEGEAVLTKIGPTSATSIPRIHRGARQRRHLPRGRLHATYCRRATGLARREGHRSKSRARRLDTVVRHAGRAEGRANPESAYAFLNYILTPRGHRRYIDFKRYANADMQGSHC